MDEEYPILISVTNTDDRDMEVVVDVLLQPADIDHAGMYLPVPRFDAHINTFYDQSTTSYSMINVRLDLSRAFLSGSSPRVLTFSKHSTLSTLARRATERWTYPFSHDQ